MVAVDDAQVVARQDRQSRGLELGKDSGDLGSGVLDQGTRGLQFNALEFVVETINSDGDETLFMELAVGGVDGRMDTADNTGHDIDARRKQEPAAALDLGMLVKDSINFFSREDVLKQPPSHNAEGGAIHEAAEYLAEDH